MKTLTIETASTYPAPHFATFTETIEFDELINKLSEEDYSELCEYSGGEDAVTAEKLAVWYSSFMSAAGSQNVGCWVNKAAEGQQDQE